MNNYSLKRNVSLMAMVFWNPRKFLNIFPEEDLFSYSVLPLFLFMVYYEILYILDCFFKSSGFTPVIALLFQISDIQYNVYQIFLFPVIHIADFFIFAGSLHVFSRLLWISVARTAFFFLFIFNTIGLVSALADSIRFVWELELLLYIHPLTGILCFVYLTEFIRRRTRIARLRSSILSLMSLAVTLGFRIVFLG